MSSTQSSPVAESIYLVLNVVGAFSLYTAYNSAKSDAGGFGDVTAALGILAQLLLVLISLPFLLKATRRQTRFVWFSNFAWLMPVVLLLLSAMTLVAMDANFSDNGILILIISVVNILPLLVFFLSRR